MAKTMLHDLEVVQVDIDDLKPYKNNARKHSAKQEQQIANSISKFGFINPLLADANNRIMAGHGRVKAAKKLGMKKVPVIRTDHLSESEIRAYIIADNKIAENAGWDQELLSIELQKLSFSTDLDVEITGFEMAEIDLIIDAGLLDEAPNSDGAPEIDDTSAITQMDDVWVLGEHLLLCGDALKYESYATLMGDDKAQMVFTDPPYNVPIDGHVCGNGKVKHDDFAMGVGEMTDGQFREFLQTSCAHMRNFSQDGALQYICMDWRHIDALIAAGKATYTDFKNICVWNKDNGGMGSLYRSKHELVAVFKHGNKPHINNIELGKHGRYRTNVWDYKGVNSFGKNQSDLKMHPTVKPVALIADAIKDCTKRGYIVLDPFAGSGSTLIAAEKTGRIARCIELDPKYCDVIIKRWQKLTGEEAYHLGSFDSFDEIVSGEEL